MYRRTVLQLDELRAFLDCDALIQPSADIPAELQAAGHRRPDGCRSCNANVEDIRHGSGQYNNTTDQQPASLVTLSDCRPLCCCSPVSAVATTTISSATKQAFVQPDQEPTSNNGLMLWLLVVTSFCSLAVSMYPNLLRTQHVCEPDPAHNCAKQTDTVLKATQGSPDRWHLSYSSWQVHNSCTTACQSTCLTDLAEHAYSHLCKFQYSELPDSLQAVR